MKFSMLLFGFIFALNVRADSKIYPTFKYNIDNIFKYENSIDFEYDINNNINVGGYIKQSVIDSEYMDKIIQPILEYNYLSKNDFLYDKNNVFYNLYFKKNIYKKDNNVFFLKIGYNNYSKKDDILIFMYSNDIYKSLNYTIGFTNYYRENSNFQIMLSYMDLDTEYKDNINFHIDQNIRINNVSNISLKYSFSKDLEKNKNKSNFLNNKIKIKYKNLAVLFDRKNLITETHTFSISNSLIMNDYLNLKFGISYSTNDYDDYYSFNFGMAF